MHPPTPNSFLTAAQINSSAHIRAFNLKDPVCSVCFSFILLSLCGRLNKHLSLIHTFSCLSENFI